MVFTVGTRRCNDDTNTALCGTLAIEMLRSMKDKFRLCDSRNTDSSFNNIARSVVGASPGQQVRTSRQYNSGWSTFLAHADYFGGFKVSESKFVEQEYWVKRHEDLAGDIRSVGNISHSVEENEQGQAQLRERLTAVLNATGMARAGTSVLDFGCGIGLLGPLFVARDVVYTGIEISPVAVKQARKRCPEGDFHVADVTCYRSASRYDLIVASYVLVHLVEDDAWQNALWCISTTLKDDGRLLLIDEVPRGERVQPARHVVNRSIREYEHTLGEFGMHIVCPTDPDYPSLLDDEAYRHFLIARRY